MTSRTPRPQRRTAHGASRGGRDHAELTGFLSRLDRRDRLAPILRGALVGSALAVLGLLVKALFESSGLLPAPGGALLEGLAWLLPPAGAASGYRPADLRRAAALGDRRGALLDLLKTAHGLEPGDPSTEAWRPLLERRAAERAATLDPGRLAPTPWRSIATLAVLLLALALARSIPTTPAGTPRGSLLPGSDHGAAAEGGEGTPAGAQQAEPGPRPGPADPADRQQRLRLAIDELPAIEPGDGSADSEITGAGRSAGERHPDAADAAEAGAAGGQGPDGEGSPETNRDLLQEVRRQLEEDGRLPAAPESGESAAEAAAGGLGTPADPDLQQVSDQLTAIEAPASTPTSQLSRRSAGVAEVAVPAGVDVQAGDAPREDSESGQPGAAEVGASTAPQEGFVDPLGAEASGIEVTLELALLESRRQEAARETIREMTPSRAAESTVRASDRPPLPSTRESPPARRPVPWPHRSLVRSFFEPPEPTAEGSAPQ